MPMKGPNVAICRKGRQDGKCRSLGIRVLHRWKMFVKGTARYVCNEIGMLFFFFLWKGLKMKKDKDIHGDRRKERGWEHSWNIQFAQGHREEGNLLKAREMSPVQLLPLRRRRNVNSKLKLNSRKWLLTKNFYAFYLKGRQTDRSHLLAYSPDAHNDRNWAGSKSGAWNPVQVSHMIGGDPTTLSHDKLPTGVCISSKLESGAEPRLKLRYFNMEWGVPRNILTAILNSLEITFLPFSDIGESPCKSFLTPQVLSLSSR